MSWLINSPLKKIVLGLVLLIVLFFLFAERAIIAYLEPAEEFIVAAVPAQPDYADLRYWAAHPKVNDSADLTPSDGKVTEPSERVDVFFVHPTTYFGPGNWNSDMRLDSFSAQGTEHIMATMASVFSQCCNVYAPQYRQAHLSAFRRPDSSASYQALDLAYLDVEKAFEHFLAERNPDTPFILAGHSQGTLHSVRLLEKYVNAKPLQEKLIAAYVIGYWIPARIFETTLTDMKVCSEPNMTGCVITYDTYDNTGPGRDPEGKLPFWSPTKGWYMARSQDTLCVNPLSWTTSNALVAKESNQGAVPMARLFSVMNLLQDKSRGYVYPELPKPLPAHSSARCAEDGSLMVDSQEDTPFANPGSGEDKSLHPNDWNLFHMNIRANVGDRIRAFLN